MDFDLSGYLSTKRLAVDNTLDEILNGFEKDQRLITAMRYSLMAGGKRLRPILCIAAAEAVGGKEPEVIYTACALEMIHTYSLIHDDLPAMDNDDLRRGKPTCHIAFDEATAILAGDALLTLAFEVLAQPSYQIKNIADRDYLSVIHKISRAAGCQGMIAGQIRDIQSEGVAINLEELEAMHQAKTGALIEASVLAGGILGGARVEEMDGLAQYARNLGLAFQVTDDILNVEGDPRILGKAVGTDHYRQKSTYPALLGIEESKKRAKKAVENALKAIDFFDIRSEPLRQLARYVLRRKQ